MHLIACIDPNYGLCYRNKRQTRDSDVIKDIFNIIGPDITLYADPYTSSYVCRAAPDKTRQLTTIKPFIMSQTIPKNAAVFLETDVSDNAIETLLLQADKVTLYIWPRAYIRTQTFPNISARGWHIAEAHVCHTRTHGDVLCYTYTK